MTRVNCVPVAELRTKQLHAEYVEITCVPTQVQKILNSGKQPKCAAKTDEYTLGTGHMRFFYDKLAYLAARYIEIHTELSRRGVQVRPCDFAVRYHDIPPRYWGGWVPTEAAMTINRERIEERYANRRTEWKD